jgi:hypothetical protein
VEVLQEKGESAYSVGTKFFIEYIADVIYFKTYKLGDLLEKYRFSGYGERYLNYEREGELNNLQIFAPAH